MIKVEESKAFIDKIRALDESVSNIRLFSIDVKKYQKEVIYTFINDKALAEGLIPKITDIADEITPKCFTSVSVAVRKVVSDKNSVEKTIKEYLKRNYTSVSYMIDDGDIIATYHESFIKYTIKAIDGTADYIIKNNLLEKITNHLQGQFCDNFTGEVVVKEGSIDTSILKDDTEIKTEIIERRFIKVKDVIVLDDREETDTATYIEDAQCAGGMTLCGTITKIREKTTKTGKPFYIIDFTDKTGFASGMYFVKKNTMERIKELQVGDGIIARCTQEYYNEKLSLKLDKINRCTFPEDFEPVRKSKKEIPEKYTVVFPKPDDTVKEISLLDNKVELPKCLSDNEFVVFDLETTGLSAGEDKITEIGAVRIKNGKIDELFQCLIDPQKQLSAQNIALTGITQEMVDGQPTFEQVVPDFYKFIGKSIMVGHNILGFDLKMLKAQADGLGYYFENKAIDTYPLATSVIVGLGNYKLNTIADKFGIEFHHHRALADAYATAEIFIELIKIKKCLPDI